MLGQAVAFIAGNLCGLLCPSALPAWFGVSGLACAILALPWQRTRALAFFLAGAGLAVVALAGHRAALQHEEERVLAEVRIAGLPQVSADGVHVDAVVSVPREPSRRVQFVRLSWPGGAGRGMRAGERWQLLLRLVPPRGGCNPGAVDTARNALRDGVQAFGTVIASPLDRRLSAAPPSLLGLRERIATSIRYRVEDPASGALLAALAVGATEDVSVGQWRIFNATGITHLVAISGSHVTAFAMVAMAAVRRSWRTAAARGLRWRRERLVVTVGVFLATGYALLAGAGVPTQRTLLMLACFVFLRQCGRVANAGTPLGLAAVAVVSLDPFCTLSAGFWLSFLAVGAILGVAGARILPEGGLRAAVSVQAAVFVALLPATLAIFGSVSLAGLWVNIFAIPVFGMVLVPLVLGATACWLVLPQALADPVAGLLVDAAALVAGFSLRLFAMAADLPWALWFASPSAGWFLLAPVAAFCILPPWGLRLRIAGAGVLLPLVGAADVPPAGDLRLTAFDMGPATAVLVETAHHRLLYGLGEVFRSKGSRTERIILPALVSRGATRLDMLVLPKLDRDSGAGVTALLARVRVPALYAPRGVGGLPPDFQSCDGAARDWDGWRVELREFPGAGCVLHVARGNRAVL
ncbi:MAG: hypothetical protein RLZZ393_2190, partial [Pseudomonadota bacterium]